MGKIKLSSLLIHIHKLILSSQWLPPSLTNSLISHPKCLWQRDWKTYRQWQGNHMKCSPELNNEKMSIWARTIQNTLVLLTVSTFTYVPLSSVEEQCWEWELCRHFRSSERENEHWFFHLTRTMSRVIVGCYRYSRLYSRCCAALGSVVIAATCFVHRYFSWMPCLCAAFWLRELWAC